MQTNSELVRLSTSDNPNYSIVWLHGLGADGYDFVPIVKELEALGIESVEYVFPHAPKIPVSINGGYVMPAWYDIKNVDLQRVEDEDGIRQSGDYVASLIDRQIARGFDPSKIVLAGFSQGGAITYYTAMRFPKRLGGFVALSTYLPLANSLDKERVQANQSTPFWVGHGTNDPVVACSRGESAVKELRKYDYLVEWKTYPMEHSVCGEELQDLAVFLKSVFK